MLKEFHCTNAPVFSRMTNQPRSPTMQRARSLLSQTIKPVRPKEMRQVLVMNPVIQPMKSFFAGFVGMLAEFIFKFTEQQMILQGNFAPVQEIGEAMSIKSIEGDIPENLPEGVYIRIGPNPKLPDKTSTRSIFGKSTSLWFEGHGMLHATYFSKDKKSGEWVVSYKNKFVDAVTLKAENENTGAFLPAVEGHPAAVIVGLILNRMRFGKFNRDLNNTNLIQHSGKVYSIAENHMPYEVDGFSLETVKIWDFGDNWNRPFTSHPKRAPRTGELVTMGVDAKKPYYVLGVISENGKNLVHKVDLKFGRSTLAHEIGVTENYNVILDYPLIVDIGRLIRGGSLIKYERDQAARFGIMPRYGDIESIKWFDVKTHCTFHIINSYEEGNEVVVLGCRSTGSIIPGPHHGINKQQWFKRAFMPVSASAEGFDPSVDGVIFPRPYEWRLNMKTGMVHEGYIVGEEWAMDFPVINERLVGLKNKFAYVQVVDSVSSSERGMSLYVKFAKLYLEEEEEEEEEESRPNMQDGKKIKVEYHSLEESQFCSGHYFVPKEDSVQEDDGWLICYVHDERADSSHVHIIDTMKFSEKPVAKVNLPQRVPYGFHGTYVYKTNTRDNTK